MIQINPDTLRIEGVDGHERRSAAEMAALGRPPCPVCGTPVIIQHIDVTTNAADELRNGRSYVLGSWDCPRGCNPRTGERLHASHNSSPEGYGCSCGASGLSFADLKENHPLGKWK